MFASEAEKDGISIPSMATYSILAKALQSLYNLIR